MFRLEISKYYPHRCANINRSYYYFREIQNIDDFVFRILEGYAKNATYFYWHWDNDDNCWFSDEIRCDFHRIEDSITFEIIELRIED